MPQADRAAALRRLEAFVGAWTLEAVFPSAPMELQQVGRSVFEWMKSGPLLIQREDSSTPDFPDSIAIVAFDPGKGTYTQHYFDSRGVVRLYLMTFHDGVWNLVRDSPDFSPLDFAQRFTGTFSDDGESIRGTWETRKEDSNWQKDFDLTYRKIT